MGKNDTFNSLTISNIQCQYGGQSFCNCLHWLIHLWSVATACSLGGGQQPPRASLPGSGKVELVLNVEDKNNF